MASPVYASVKECPPRPSFYTQLAKLDHAIRPRAAHGNGHGMVRCRSESDKLPRVRIVVDRGSEPDARRTVGVELHRESVERQRQPHAARLDVRLLQRP